MGRLLENTARAALSGRGLVLVANCDDDMTGSTTTIDCLELAGFGNDYFNTRWYLQILKNKNSTGSINSVVAAPTVGGAGYTAADVLTVSEGTGGTVTADTVAAGVVTGISLTTGGDGYTIGAGKATTGGTGTGCTIEISTIGSIESEVRQITDYVSSSGVFTCSAFSNNVEAHDSIMILHESIALMGLHADATLAKMVDDSWIAHILTVDGDVSDFNDNTMSLEALNIDTDALITSVALVPQSGGTVTWNATALQSIEDECQDALETENLNELVQDAVTTNLQTCTDNASVMGYVLAKADVANFDRTTDSLEAIGELVASAAIEGECLDALESVALDHLITILIPAALDALVVDNSLLGYIMATADVSTYDRTTDSLEALGTALIAVDTELALIPQSGGTTSWNATALAAITTQCTLSITNANIDHLTVACADNTDPVDMTEIADHSILANIIDDGGDVSAYDRRYHSLHSIAAGTARIAITTEDFNQVAAAYTLFTGTTTDVILESLSIRLPNVNCSDDVGAFTGISVQTDDVTVATIIAQADGVKANLTAEAQLGWTGTLIIKVGTIVTLTIYGGASDAACAADVMVKYRSTGAGNGTLMA